MNFKLKFFNLDWPSFMADQPDKYMPLHIKRWWDRGTSASQAALNMVLIICVRPPPAYSRNIEKVISKKYETPTFPICNGSKGNGGDFKYLTGPTTIWRKAWSLREFSRYEQCSRAKAAQVQRLFSERELISAFLSTLALPFHEHPIGTTETDFAIFIQTW